MTVELHPAFLWTCHACGVDHFVRTVLFTHEQVERLVADGQLSKEQLEEAEAANEDGEWLFAPDVVTCGECGAVFGAVTP
ncbi:MAG: hypothetical protein AB7G11_02415 [Phycisphaerales bacterium]